MQISRLRLGQQQETLYWNEASTLCGVLSFLAGCTTTELVGRIAKNGYMPAAQYHTCTQITSLVHHHCPLFASAGSHFIRHSDASIRDGLAHSPDDPLIRALSCR